MLQYILGDTRLAEGLPAHQIYTIHTIHNDNDNIVHNNTIHNNTIHNNIQ